MLDTVLDREGKIVSAEVAAKRKASDDANRLLIDQVADVVDPNMYTFDTDFDYLGRTKDKSSFIAVVHADGNDMGLVIRKLKDKFSTPQKNRDYINYMRKFSEKVKLASRSAVTEMTRLLLLSIEEERGNFFIRGVHAQADIRLTRDRDKRYVLPFRPLVSGGDDITFVCDGRIGIDLAVRFLEVFERQTEVHLQRRLTGCAGVAIVNAHYPFSRAYELAEELCQSAKKERKESNHKDSSLMDWHYTTGGLYDELDEMRKRDYTVAEGELVVRPLYITGVVSDELQVRTWAQVQRVATEFQIKWHDSRSKAKGLMDALRAGNAGAQAFKMRYLDYQGLIVPQMNGKNDQFWSEEGRCLYYDALELMDLYIPITSTNSSKDDDHVSQD